MTEAADKPDYATLRWVREGLEETIHAARQSLESYLDSGFKAESLGEFLVNTHRVLGTLRMVQAYGAAMLAEEMELVAKGLANGSVKPGERVAESLMLGLLQLPNYIARLESGEPDVPLMLLPVINDLRAARNAPPASEIASYAPNLDRLIEAEPVLAGTGSPVVQALIKRYRNRFHRGLLHWYKDDGKDEGLRQVLDVVCRINGAAGTARLRRLAEAIEALVIVLSEGEFTASEEVKRLFSRVDRVLKQLLDEGEEAAMTAFPMDLLKHLLYFVSRSHSHNTVVNGVRKEADIANSFPDDLLLGGSQATQESRAGQDILDAVREVLLADLETVKDGLDLFIRGDHSDTKRLAGLPDLLNRIGDTLGMLGRGALRYRLQFCRDKLIAANDHAQGLSEDDLMSVATELVAVESLIGTMRAGVDEAEVDAKVGEANANLEAILKEAGNELTAIKDACEKFVANDEDYAQMGVVQTNTHRLANVFSMAGMEELSALLVDLEPSIEAIGTGLSPVPKGKKQALVDLFAGLDYYLESRLDRRENLPKVMAAMHESLALIQAPAEPEEESAIESPALQGTADVGEELGADIGLAPEEKPAGEISSILQDMDLEELFHSDLVEHIEISSEILDEPEVLEPVLDLQGGSVVESVAGAENAEVAVHEIQLEEIDPEIFDIFMEEAAEELGVIQERYPLWRADSGDEDSLKTFRRSFHTLKGSGRMVGANTIGEFAWSVENLLNRILDGRVTPNRHVIQLMDDVLLALPVLIDAQAHGKVLKLDIEEIKQRAFSYAENKFPEEESVDQASELTTTEPERQEAPYLALIESHIVEEEEPQPTDSQLIAEPLSLSEENLVAEEAAQDTDDQDLSDWSGLNLDESGSSLLAELAPDVSDSMLEDLVIRPFAEDEPDSITDIVLEGDGSEHPPVEAEVVSQDTLSHEIEEKAETLTDALDLKELAESHTEEPLEQIVAEISESIQSVSELSQQADSGGLSHQDVGLASVMLADDLFEIFASESESHLQILADFLESCRKQPQPVSEEMLRAIHTLRGSSHLAGVDAMAEVAGAMEGYVNHLRRAKARVGGQPLELLDRFHSVMLTSLHAINVPGAELAEWRPLLADIHAADQQLPEVISELNEPALVAVRLDPELLDIFLEEAAEVSERLEAAFSDWSRNLDDQEPLDAIKRELHTLKGGARLAGIPGLGDLIHALESLFTHAGETGLPVAVDLMEMSRLALDEIENALDMLHLNGALPDLQPAIAKLGKQLSDQQEEEMTSRPDSVLGSESESSEVHMEESSEGVESILLSDSWEEDSHLVEEPFLHLVKGERPLDELASKEQAQKPDIDPELLAIFLEDALENIEQLENSYNDWISDLASKEAIDQIMRSLHTIKGNARFAGLFGLGDLCHAMESLFGELGEGNISAEFSLTQLARRALDQLAGSIDQLHKNKPLANMEPMTRALEAAGRGEAWAVADLESVLLVKHTESLLHKTTTQLLEEVESVLATRDSSFIADSKLLTDSELFTDSQLILETNAELIGEGGSAKSNILQFPEREKIDFTRPSRRPPALQPEESSDGSQQERVRVQSGLLDQLVNNAGEVSIYRSRLEQQNNRVNHNLVELNDTIGRLRNQLRSLELETEAQVLSRHERKVEEQRYDDFDPLEMDRYSTIQQLSRALSETINDLSNIGETLEDLSKDTDTLLLQQARISNDLQDGLLRTRMVPFDSQSSRLQRVVRQTAQTLGKNAILDIQGAEGEIDRTILNRMLGPMEHLLRNSVAHGIELPHVRHEAGKPEQGKVTLRLSREGTEIVLTLADDGAGLNASAIREKAIQKGMLAPDAALSDEDIYQLILKPGFSTVEEVTQVSGRGVGMDVVLSEVKQLGGTLEMDSQDGRGSSFVIRLPFTLAITEALLVKVADEIYAIPHGSVEIIIRAKRQELISCYSGKQSGIEYGGKEYLARYLGSMLGFAEPQLPSTNKWFPVLLVRSGEQRMAIQVDYLVGNFQVVVKSIGSQLSGVHWFTGGTILADGRIALLLDLNTLVRTERLTQQSRASKEEQVQAGITVMVVDDSITVRKVTSRLLERHNMTVLTAKDGVDAVTVLQDHKPDIMLLDIEMPRMDGYELARHIRHTPELKDIPIIMITSRSGEKHRQRAMELGVNRYLGKPYQEADLLDNIYTLLAEHAYE